MTNDPRSALNRLIAAFEAHLDAAATGDELSPAVIASENALQNAFFTYDDEDDHDAEGDDEGEFDDGDGDDDENEYED